MSEKLVHLQPTICIQQTLPIMTSFQLQECFEVIALCVASIYLTICICIGFFKADLIILLCFYQSAFLIQTTVLPYKDRTSDHSLL